MCKCCFEKINDVKHQMIFKKALKLASTTTSKLYCAFVGINFVLSRHFPLEQRTFKTKANAVPQERADEDILKYLLHTSAT